MEYRKILEPDSRIFLVFYKFPFRRSKYFIDTINLAPYLNDRIGLRWIYHYYFENITYSGVNIKFLMALRIRKRVDSYGVSCNLAGGTLLVVCLFLGKYSHQSRLFW